MHSAFRSKHEKSKHGDAMSSSEEIVIAVFFGNAHSDLGTLCITRAEAKKLTLHDLDSNLEKHDFEKKILFVLRNRIGIQILDFNESRTITHSHLLA
jgi:hypothetical protein